MTAPVPASEHTRSGQLTNEELAQARLFLQQTLNSVIGATKLLSEAQWNYKPAPEQWSIAQNLDHIVAVQERVLGMLAQLADAPAAPADRDPQVVDAIVIHRFPTRLGKFTAPEFIQPADQIVPAERLDRLQSNCLRFSDALDSIPGLRDHLLEAPPLKAVSKGEHTVMDGYQWILAEAAHTERHAKQMLEVIADPGFPA